MLRYFDDLSLRVINDEEIKLPDAKKVCDKVLDEAKRLYSEFDNIGKFYEGEFVREFGKTYVSIKESDGYGEPYKIIGDWLGELTGEMGINFHPATFKVELENFTDELILKEIKGLNSFNENEFFDILGDLSTLGAACEIVESISEEPIETITGGFGQ